VGVCGDGADSESTGRLHARGVTEGRPRGAQATEVMSLTVRARMIEESGRATVVKRG
jgi:hypothetical protein